MSIAATVDRLEEPLVPGRPMRLSDRSGRGVRARRGERCAGWGGGAGGGGADSINVLMVNNPQMVDLQKLTADNFTKQTGIKVNFTVLPENDVRDKISQEFSSQAGQYDVASLSATSRSRSTPRPSGSRRSTATSPRTRPSTRPTSSSR